MGGWGFCCHEVSVIAGVRGTSEKAIFGKAERTGMENVPRAFGLVEA